jgi:pimeloyl-ACP methyl ester carboxylesterase
VSAPEPFEIGVGEDAVSDLRQRLERTRWPEQPAGHGWDLGTDLAYARELCEHWRNHYDFSRLERLNALGSARWEGLHFLRVDPGSGGEGDPVVLLHGWPSGPIEYERAATLLAAAGRTAIVPSLPGFAWSEDPGEPLDVAGVAGRLFDLLGEGLGLERFIVAGGDWGAPIAARMAFDSPKRVAGLYISTPGVVPRPSDLSDPPLSEDEQAFVERGLRWFRREGHHMAIQSAAPDVISVALTDSPAGLASYLVEKYRRWADTGGDVETRFSKDELCDFLTMFWTTGCIASSLRIYWAERRGRWHLGPKEAIGVPAAIGAFHAGMQADGESAGVIGNPPPEWTRRVLGDLRHWSEPPRGAHFSAFEEPELYAADLLEFADAL